MLTRGPREMFASRTVVTSLSPAELAEKNDRAYARYAPVYAPLSLCAYTFVWRGNILRHISFFRDILRYGSTVVDLAVGDGALTSAALFSRKGPQADRVIAVDLSERMLEVAKRRLPAAHTTLLRADVAALPFADASIPVLSCFGGLNSFASPELALREMARVLQPETGIMRGSYLIMPKTQWKKRLVRHWIAEGYQSGELELSCVRQAFTRAGLQLSLEQRMGDVILFEARRGGHGS